MNYLSVKHYTTDWDDVKRGMSKNCHLLSLGLWFSWRTLKWGFVYSFVMRIPELSSELTEPAKNYFAFQAQQRQNLNDILGLSGISSRSAQQGPQFPNQLGNPSFDDMMARQQGTRYRLGIDPYKRGNGK